MTAIARYLADTSIWSWANRGERPDVRNKLAERFERGEVVTCAPVVLEAMCRPRTGWRYESVHDELFAPLDCLPMTNEVAERALVVQRGMAQATGGRQIPPAIDCIIAAIAEASGRDVVLWALDPDMGAIAEHTRQPYEAESSSGPSR